MLNSFQTQCACLQGTVCGLLMIKNLSLQDENHRLQTTAAATPVEAPGTACLPTMPRPLCKTDLDPRMGSGKCCSPGLLPSSSKCGYQDPIRCSSPNLISPKANCVRSAALAALSGTTSVSWDLWDSAFTASSGMRKHHTSRSFTDAYPCTLPSSAQEGRAKNIHAQSPASCAQRSTCSMSRNFRTATDEARQPTSAVGSLRLTRQSTTQLAEHWRSVNTRDMSSGSSHEALHPHACSTDNVPDSQNTGSALAVPSGIDSSACGVLAGFHWMRSMDACMAHQSAACASMHRQPSMKAARWEVRECLKGIASKALGDDCPRAQDIRRTTIDGDFPVDAFAGSNTAADVSHAQGAQQPPVQLLLLQAYSRNRSKQLTVSASIASAALMVSMGIPNSHDRPLGASTETLNHNVMKHECVPFWVSASRQFREEVLQFAGSPRGPGSSGDVQSTCAERDGQSDALCGVGSVTVALRIPDAYKPCSEDVAAKSAQATAGLEKEKEDNSLGNIQECTGDVSESSEVPSTCMPLLIIDVNTPNDTVDVAGMASGAIPSADPFMTLPKGEEALTDNRKVVAQAVAASSQISEGGVHTACGSLQAVHTASQIISRDSQHRDGQVSISTHEDSATPQDDDSHMHLCCNHGVAGDRNDMEGFARCPLGEASFTRHCDIYGGATGANAENKCKCPLYDSARAVGCHGMEDTARCPEDDDKRTLSSGVATGSNIMEETSSSSQNEPVKCTDSQAAWSTDAMAGSCQHILAPAAHVAVHRACPADSLVVPSPLPRTACTTTACFGAHDSPAGPCGTGASHPFACCVATAASACGISQSPFDIPQDNLSTFSQPPCVVLLSSPFADPTENESFRAGSFDGNIVSPEIFTEAFPSTAQPLSAPMKAASLPAKAVHASSGIEAQTLPKSIVAPDPSCQSFGNLGFATAGHHVAKNTSSSCRAIEGSFRAVKGSVSYSCCDAECLSSKSTASPTCAQSNGLGSCSGPSNPGALIARPMNYSGVPECLEACKQTQVSTTHEVPPLQTSLNPFCIPPLPEHVASSHSMHHPRFQTQHNSLHCSASCQEQCSTGFVRLAEATQMLLEQQNAPLSIARLASTHRTSVDADFSGLERHMMSTAITSTAQPRSSMAVAVQDSQDADMQAPTHSTLQAPGREAMHACGKGLNRVPEPSIDQPPHSTLSSSRSSMAALGEALLPQWSAHRRASHEGSLASNSLSRPDRAPAEASVTLKTPLPCSPLLTGKVQPLSMPNPFSGTGPTDMQLKAGCPAAGALCQGLEAKGKRASITPTDTAPTAVHMKKDRLDTQCQTHEGSCQTASSTLAAHRNQPLDPRGCSAETFTLRPSHIEENLSAVLGPTSAQHQTFPNVPAIAITTVAPAAACASEAKPATDLKTNVTVQSPGFSAAMGSEYVAEGTLASTSLGHSPPPSDLVPAAPSNQASTNPFCDVGIVATPAERASSGTSMALHSKFECFKAISPSRPGNSSSKTSVATDTISQNVSAAMPTSATAEPATCNCKENGEQNASSGLAALAQACPQVSGQASPAKDSTGAVVATSCPFSGSPTAFQDCALTRPPKPFPNPFCPSLPLTMQTQPWQPAPDQAFWPTSGSAEAAARCSAPILPHPSPFPSATGAGAPPTTSSEHLQALPALWRHASSSCRHPQSPCHHSSFITLPESPHLRCQGLLGTTATRGDLPIGTCTASMQGQASSFGSPCLPSLPDCQIAAPAAYRPHIKASHSQHLPNATANLQEQASAWLGAVCRPHHVPRYPQQPVAAQRRTQEQASALPGASPLPDLFSLPAPANLCPTPFGSKVLCQNQTTD
jgi:hypothetical protein